LVLNQLKLTTGIFLPKSYRIIYEFLIEKLRTRKFTKEAEKHYEGEDEEGIGVNPVKFRSRC
jgi:hypothetical protein